MLQRRPTYSTSANPSIESSNEKYHSATQIWSSKDIKEQQNLENCCSSTSRLQNETYCLFKLRNRRVNILEQVTKRIITAVSAADVKKTALNTKGLRQPRSGKNEKIYKIWLVPYCVHQMYQRPKKFFKFIGVLVFCFGHQRVSATHVAIFKVIHLRT